jgi:polysaccharide export outer membrane protein
MIKKVILCLTISTLLFSCAPKERLIYFQGIDKQGKNETKLDYQPVLQPDDLLLIIVSAPEPEAAIPYNLIAYTSSDNSSDRTNNGGLRYQTYLVDSKGNIEFPILGSISLGGLTKTEAIEKLKGLLKKYINSPIVNLRITNYKISILGEVSKPGSYNVVSERITLPEALSLAGDLTIYGNRKEILIIRDVEGVKEHTFIDITSPEFINSPYYYLDQNDLVYVNPNKTKINSSVVGPNVTVGISAVSLLITIIALLIR